MHAFLPGHGHLRGQPFTVGETRYPGNWVEHASSDEIAALGIILPPPLAPGECLIETDTGWTVRPAEVAP